MYGAPIWRCATETQAYICQAEAVLRQACLRMISGRPHVSYDATYLIAGVPLLALLVDERARIFQRRPEDVKEEERRETLRRWQDRWDRAPKGRWTHWLIPNIEEWVERGHEEVDYYLTQLLSEHGFFKSHNQRYDNTLSALCPACPNTIEDAEHVFFRCPRFQEEMERLQQVLQEEIEPDNIVRLILETAGNWLEVASFAQSVVSRLRQEAQEI
uniref:Reverse transcriptase zinc-binding domain-containing protein n=1 Tax=Trichogramma kaykai TaxID=54128 RepID=A0ABD2WNH4_9HYME